MNRFLTPLLAQGLIACASAQSPRFTPSPLHSSAPWSQAFHDSPQGRHPVDPARIDFFRGQTVRDFRNNLIPGTGYQRALEDIERIAAAGGAQDVVDTTSELMHVIDVFLPPRSDTNFSHLLPFSLTRTDYNFWARLDMVRMMEHPGSNMNAPSLTATLGHYQFSTTHHPYATLIERVPNFLRDRFRSLPVFERFASELTNQLPQIRASRRLTALYPGSGSHIAPLITAMNLIDGGKIDRARFIYTEINARPFEEIQYLLNVAAHRNLIQDLQVGETVDFSEGGQETVLSFTYRGATIEILFAFRRSGQAFYRDDHLRQADWVIIHDLSGIQNSYRLLGDVMMSRKNMPDHPQAVLMEGEILGNPWAEFNFPAGLRQTYVDGQYGHCEDDVLYGEQTDCAFRSARTFLLNDPGFTRWASSFSSAQEIQDALLHFLR